MRRIVTVGVLLMLALALVLPASARAAGLVSTLLTVESVAVVYGANQAETVATLTDADTGAGVPGQLINFLVAGQFHATMTDASGRAVLRGLSTGRLAAGSYPGAVQARYDGRTAYTPSSGAGDLTVGRRPLRVVPVAIAREYGDPNPTTLPYRLENFAPGEDMQVLATLPVCTTEAAPASPVGTYPIQCAGLEAANYEAEYTAAAFTVKPVPMDVRASDAARRYGEANPAFTATYLGTWKLGEGPEVLEGVLKCTPGAAAVSRWAPTGTYRIDCTGQSATNYALRYIPGKLTIGK